MEHSYQEYPNHMPDPHSQGFGIASIVLGIVGIATGCCAYPSIICGALAVLFALLSKGGTMTLSDRGRVGMILGVISLAIGVLMLVFSLIYMILTFGSFANYMKNYMDLLEQIDPTYQQNIFY